MSKRRVLSEREIAILRRSGGNGYLPYRYGSPKPVTLPPIFTGQARKAKVGDAINLLRGWRLSPFELEGTTRAGLRSGLCRNGYAWPRADREAETLVAEALHLIGAKRPTWIEGQWQYTAGQDYCWTCRGALDEEARTNKARFCCPECATVARESRHEVFAHATNLARYAAFYATAKEKIPERDCAWCGTSFRPAKVESVTCSDTCRSHLAAQTLARKAAKAQPKPCAQCGAMFRPLTKQVRYCSDPCRLQFFADKKAAKAAERRGDRSCPGCLSVFTPKRANQIYCGEKCSARVLQRELRQRTKASAFRCEEATEYREAAE